MTDARIPVTEATRDALKECKRGGETYEELLRKMIKQYEPEEAETPLPNGGGTE